MRMQPERAAGSAAPIPTPDQQRRRLTRRAFMGAGAGAGALLLQPAAALAGSPRTNNSPNPTANKITLGGVTFSLTFFGPGLDPSSITDFNGFVGVADVQGTGTATNPDGSTETLLYDTDMRFMSGTYVAQDGQVYRGTFGFVWLDLYRGQYDFENFSTQVHDFDQGITPYPGGLFWTVPLHAPDGVTVNFGAGKAQMTATDLPTTDYFDIPNALFLFEVPVSSPASCSFDITWSGPVTDRSPVSGPAGSAGQLVMCDATMQWSAGNALGFRFETDPTAPTKSVFAQLGKVTNGVFAHERS
jgi:hypothetical protein